MQRKLVIIFFLESYILKQHETRIYFCIKQNTRDIELIKRNRDVLMLMILAATQLTN